MHYTTRKFWKCYDTLPENVQDLDDIIQQSHQNLELLYSPL
jgi:hypothetical protein